MDIKIGQIVGVNKTGGKCLNGELKYDRRYISNTERVTMKQVLDNQGTQNCEDKDRTGSG